ncbi:MAG: hypothetical protein NUV37_02520, partial [Nanoarchaeota archaeon]|nr:hypothetical protein [Nanoarchaeota archaeon]
YMAMTNDIRIRVSKSQREVINNNARVRGYANISSYMRDLALKEDRIIESKIIETNQKVKEILEVLQNG